MAQTHDDTLPVTNFNFIHDLFHHNEAQQGTRLIATHLRQAYMCVYMSVPSVAQRAQYRTRKGSFTQVEGSSLLWCPFVCLLSRSPVNIAQGVWNGPGVRSQYETRRFWPHNGALHFPSRKTDWERNKSQQSLSTSSDFLPVCAAVFCGNLLALKSYDTFEWRRSPTTLDTHSKAHLTTTMIIEANTLFVVSRNVPSVMFY